MYDAMNNLAIHTAAKEEPGVVTVIPVFSSKGPLQIPELTKKKGLSDTVGRYTESGVFRARPLELLPLMSENVFLIGLGSVETFHPDRLAALFRELGERISPYEGGKFQILFTSELKEVIERFDRIATGKAAMPQSVSQPLYTTDNPDEMEIAPDYFVPFSVTEAVSQMVSGLLIGAANLDLMKTDRKKKKRVDIGFSVPFLSGAKLADAIDRGEKLAKFVNATRVLSVLPGNLLNPDEFERYAKKIARDYKLKVKVFGAAKLKTLGCGGILTVGQGSNIPPRMIIVEHNPQNASKKERLVLVGKGVTFDTGGISLKPSADMHEMKYDMTGAATVLHAVAAARARNLPFHVVGILGIAENMPSGSAVKPGDIYTAYNGRTVEVQNTDAEGRLILGDLLAYGSQHYRGSYMIDFATLTGACRVALGEEAAAVLTLSDSLAARIDAASRKSLDRSWRLPHWYQFGAGLKSDIADLRNIAGREGGTISAMRFLAQFVDLSHIRWAHIDIAGTAWRKKGAGSQPGDGATGWGIRLINQFLEDLAEKND